MRRAILTRQAQPFSLDRYRVAQLPSASQWTGAQVHVTDEVDGAVTCFSDGTNWRRITDRAIAVAAVPAALSSAGMTAGDLDAVIGPYMISMGLGTGTFASASLAAAEMYAAGLTDGALQTPPKVPADIDADGIAVGTMSGAARISAALTATGAGVGILDGVAA